MSVKIALISTPLHCDYLRTLDYSSLDCEVSFVTYQNWRELPELYDKVCDDFDGVCTTGIFAKELLLRAKSPKTIPIECVMVQSVEYYKEFFRLLSENRSIDFSRVVLDFSLAMEEGPKTVLDYVQSRFVVESQRKRVFSDFSTERLIQRDRAIVAQAETLWQEKKFDLVIVRHSSVAPMLEQRGIPYAFVYPDPENVFDSLRLLLNEIKIEHMSSALPAVIFITSAELRKSAVQEINTESLDLQKCLLEFDRQNTTGFFIQRAASGFEIFTSRHIIERITRKFTDCSLQKYIFSHCGWETQIGYGLGYDIMQARNHAYEACRQTNRNAGSYAVTEKGDLIGPLSAGNALRLSADLSEGVLLAAKRSGLSVSTIQRVLSATDLLGRKEITTNELASILQVTVANANRFLNALVNSNQAQIVSVKKSCAKGRPSRVYQINIDF